MENIIIRSKMPSDDDFIFDSWLNNYQATSYFAKRMKKQTFMKYHPVIANAIMDRPSTICKIAGDKDFTIFGYIIAEPFHDAPVVHYLYVRPEFQRLGIGKALFEATGIKGAFEVSHWTPALNEIHFKHRFFDFNPYKM
jgi:GNAT superfamily N-acetyltransferase